MGCSLANASGSEEASRWTISQSRPRVVYIPRGLGSRFTTFLRSYAQDDGLPFSATLTEAQIEQAAVDEGVDFASAEGCVWPPAVTLWAFVGQFVGGHKTCVAAVARVIVLLVAMGREPCSAATGAYCKGNEKGDASLFS